MSLFRKGYHSCGSSSLTDLYHMCWALGFHIFRINEKSLLELSLLLVTCSAAFRLPSSSPPLRKEGRRSCGKGRSMASLQLARSASRAAFVPVRRHQAEGEKKQPLFATTMTTRCGPALWSGWRGPAAQAQSFTHTCSGFTGYTTVWHRTRNSRMQEELFPKSLKLNSCCWRKRLEKSHTWSTVKLYINTLAGSNKTSSESLKEDPKISSWRFIKVLFFSLCDGDSGTERRRRRRRVWSENDAPIRVAGRTNKTEFCLAGRRLAFWDFKKPPEKMIPQLNRYPHSKAPCLASDGKREGWGASDGAGGRCRQRADTMETLKNELLNTSIKKYKTWPHF